MVKPRKFIIPDESENPELYNLFLDFLKNQLYIENLTDVINCHFIEGEGEINDKYADALTDLILKRAEILPILLNNEVTELDLLTKNYTIHYNLMQREIWYEQE